MSKERRKAFDRRRKELLGAYGINALICARCGRFKDEVHLHHIVSVFDGGNDTASNLIPLCGACHRDWDVWEYSGVDFSVFLHSPTSLDLAALYAQKIPVTAEALEYVHNMRYVVNSLCWSDERDSERSYFDEIRRQNEVFCRYPYSVRGGSKRIGVPGVTQAGMILSRMLSSRAEEIPLETGA